MSIDQQHIAYWPRMSLHHINARVTPAALGGVISEKFGAGQSQRRTPNRDQRLDVKSSHNRPPHRLKSLEKKMYVLLCINYQC